MQQYKVCYKCKQMLSIDFFHKKSTGKFGVTGTCKFCSAIISAEWRKNNPERKKINDKKWAQANPDRTAAAKRRYSDKNKEAEKARKAAAYLANKESRDKKSRLWSKQNPEKERKRKRNWRRNNPEKARQENHKYRSKLRERSFAITKKEIAKLIAPQKCFYCQEHTEKPTLEHVIPIARGGNHSIGNLVSACGICNSSKQDKTIMEWRVWKLRQETA